MKQSAGKYLYILLDGKGRMPVLHFGMTGMLKVLLALREA